MNNRRATSNSKQNCEIFAVVSGSFRRFLPEIQKVVGGLTRLDITVLSPKVAKPISDVNGFVILEKDKGSPGQIEKKHLSAILRSDFLYVVNPGGYIGPSVALEIGYALSHRIPVYSSNESMDEVFRDLVDPGVSFAVIKQRIIKRKTKTNHALKPAPTLNDLQAYVSRIVRYRGFSEEDLTDVALLLFEEVGELAKAIRTETGLKVEERDLRHRKSLRVELADCLIYLADLANLANVSLEDALREKESINTSRKWETGSTDHKDSD